jgi:pilus assembly protein CpaC
MTSAQASIVGQPLPRLDIGARNGWAKVLKQSTLITGNGVEATFFDGGELNFKVASGINATIQKIEYGSHVKMLPRYDSSTKDIEVRIASDVSEIVPNNGGEIPGRTTTRLDTSVNLKLGQALVLSGFKTMNRTNDVQGVPILSEIPVLGLFFGSHTKIEKETEGAIFIIPSVIETVPKSSLEVVKGALATYKGFAGSMQNLDTYPTMPPSAN